jgi:hypothetical protein
MTKGKGLKGLGGWLILGGIGLIMSFIGFAYTLFCTLGMIIFSGI